MQKNKFLQCPKILCLKKNLPYEFDDNAMNQAILQTGDDVGHLAKGLFGAYAEVSCADIISTTKKLIDDGVENICEASFSYDGCFWLYSLGCGKA